MSKDKEGFRVRPVIGRFVNIDNQVMNVDRKPWCAKNKNHGDEHSICSASPFSLEFFFSRRFGSRFASRSFSKFTTNFDVTERNNDERNNKLKDSCWETKGSAWLCSWPSFLTVMFGCVGAIDVLMEFIDGHEPSVRKSQNACCDPNTSYNEETDFYFHPWFERIDDDKETINGDRHQSEGWNVDGDSLSVWQEMA